MYLNHRHFMDCWADFPLSLQPFITFCYLYDKQRELRAFKKLLRRPVGELDRLTYAYVARIQVRPLLVNGGISFVYPENVRGRNAPFPFKFCHIYLMHGTSKRETLKTFVHELIHIYLCEHGVVRANEDWIDAASDHIMAKHRDSIEKLFDEQEVEWIHPKPQAK